MVCNASEAQLSFCTSDLLYPVIASCFILQAIQIAFSCVYTTLDYVRTGIIAPVFFFQVELGLHAPEVMECGCKCTLTKENKLRRKLMNFAWKS